MSKTAQYDAFISYSHSESGEIAAAMQLWLQRYAKPWWHRRAIAVFRDRTDLSVAPSGWGAIEKALNDSDWLVLFLNPEAAKSKWIKREIRHWLGDKEAGTRELAELDKPMSAFSKDRREKILIVLTNGQIVWHDRAKGQVADFNWKETTAVPKCLSGVFAAEPFWADVRPLVDDENLRGGLDRGNPVFMDAVARISAAIRPLDLSALIGEDSRLHRQAIRTAWYAGASLTALSVAVTIFAIGTVIAGNAATLQMRAAETLRKAAEARALAATNPSGLHAAGLKARAAYRQMQELAQERLVPEWLQSPLLTIANWIPQVFGGFADATIRRQPPAPATAIDVMRFADDLTPRLVKSVSVPRSSGARAISFDQKANILIGRSFANALQIWDLKDGAQDRTISFSTPTSRTNGRVNLAFSGDGKWMTYEASASGSIVLQQTNSADVKLSFKTDSLFDTAGAKPAPGRAAKSGTAITERFVAGTGRRSAQLAGIALDDDGDRLVLVSRDGTVILFAVSDGGEAKELSRWQMDRGKTGDPARMAEWSLDRTGKLLAATSTSHEIGAAPLFVWNAADGSKPYPFRQYPSTVTSNSFSRVFDLAVTGTADGELFIWETDSGRQRRRFSAADRVNSAALGNGLFKRYVAVGSKDFLQVFDMISGLEVVRAPHPGRIDSLTWSVDGAMLVSGSSVLRGPKQDQVRIWDLGAAQKVPVTRMYAKYNLVRISASGDIVAAIGWRGHFYIWSAKTGKPDRRFRKAKLMRLAIAVDAGTRTVTALTHTENTLATRFDLKSGTQRTIPGPNYSTVVTPTETPHISAATLDGTGSTLARVVKANKGRATTSCTIEVWNLRNAAEIGKWPCAAEIDDIALSRDGKHLAWINRGPAPSIGVRDLSGKTDARSIKLPQSKHSIVGRQLTFSGNGQRLAAAWGTKAQIFATATGQALSQPMVLGADVINLELDGTGDRLAAALADRTLRLFAIPSGRMTEVLNFKTDTIGSGGLSLNETTGDLYAVFNDSNAQNQKVWKWRLNPADVYSQLGNRFPVVPATEMAIGSGQRGAPAKNE